ncbi:hypothetical protein [Phaeobacter gallaeciensis]|uniref:hypothetical protein n=1 Tax=Phaeobacter gallaeciensis TaxID=60890 RepID=UPI00237F53D4|nr:hypothetical protein [Phaeobacter gallaeciensis]MDE4192449.1 hypothetical protein [Phaeobacter gallaeciensis]MDE4201769.1 hypothetical protein [Phaeobacter gallaeciensis]MDE4205237.1 hypothetical protein [Phaeobacter gallaeciensis]MDE4209376.1 hypothetical protein [Phaeobacter gallaeciensis]MDE4217572.1 hypothetical protein [Phaeobacter gallaeciensis]
MSGQIPGTNLAFSTNDAFDEGNFYDFSKQILRNDDALEDFKSDPVAKLEKLGVIITDGDGNTVGSEQLGTFVASTSDEPPFQNASVAMVVATVVTIAY